MEPCAYFLYLSHLLYGISVNIFIINRYISRSYTIYRAGAAVVSTITSSHSSRENTTPSSGTSPIASCKRVPPGHFLWLGGSKTKTLMNLYWKESASLFQSGVLWRLVRASDRSQKKVKFRGIFWDKTAEKSADFAEFSGQTWPESNR